MSKTEAEQQPSLRDQLAALAEIVDQLEDPEASLEDSIALYERGMALVKSAGNVLQEAEQRVALVTGNDEVQALDS